MSAGRHRNRAESCVGILKRHYRIATCYVENRNAAVAVRASSCGSWNMPQNCPNRLFDTNSALQRNVVGHA